MFKRRKAIDFLDGSLGDRMFLIDQKVKQKVRYGSLENKIKIMIVNILSKNKNKNGGKNYYTLNKE